MACQSEQKVTYSSAKAEKTNLSTSVTATGTIEPVTKVEVGTQVLTTIVMSTRVISWQN